MRVVASIFVIGCVGIGMSLPAPAFALSLEQALVAAYQNSPTLQSARAQARATDEGVPQALARVRPSLSATGSLGGLRSTQSNRPAGQQTVYTQPRSVGLTVTQPLYSGGSATAAIAAAEARVRADQANLHLAEQQVLMSAATAYANVLRDQAILELSISNQSVLQRQLEAARDRFRVGELTRTDLSQAEARVAGAKALRINSEGNLLGSRASFQAVIGLAPTDLEPLNIALELPASSDQAIALAQRNSPRVRQAIAQLEAAEEFIRESAGALLPSLTLNGNLSRSEDSTGNGARSDNASLTLNLTLPIYQGGGTYSRLRQARQTAAMRRYDLDQARDTVTQNATISWESLTSAQAQITSLQEQVDAAAVALDGVRREAQVGSRTVLDVLNAEQELLDAKVKLLSARRDAVIAAYRMREAIGSLTAKGLSLPVVTYDPAAHMQEVRNKWFGGSSSGELTTGNTNP